MKKTLLSLLAALTAVVFVAGISLAAPPKGAKLTGTVKAVDIANGTVTICATGSTESKVYTMDAKFIEKKNIMVGNVVDAIVDLNDTTKILKIRKAQGTP